MKKLKYSGGLTITVNFVIPKHALVDISIRVGECAFPMCFTAFIDFSDICAVIVLNFDLSSAYRNWKRLETTTP